jgi:hypothetical protein
MERVVISQKSYAAAYRCEDCPQSNGTNGCPKWVELLETNDVTGHERMTSGCVDQMMPNIAVNLIKAANRPAAEISAMRDDVARRMELATAHVLNQARATTSQTLIGRAKQFFLSRA